MMPKTTKHRLQEVSKCLLERMCGFEARSHSIFHDFGLQHGLNMGSKIVQKTLKNRLGRPKAAEKPQGTHFDPKLSLFWTILATNFASKSAQIDFIKCKGNIGKPCPAKCAACQPFHAGCLLGGRLWGRSPTGDPATELRNSEAC